MSLNTPQEFQDFTDQLETDGAKLHKFVHGTDTEEVATEGGNVDTIAKLVLYLRNSLTNALSASSASEITIGLGAQTFEITGDKYFSAGMIVLVEKSDDATKWMLGSVTSYAGTTLTLDITETNGAGTFSDWTIVLTGLRGLQGIQGAAGNDGADGADGASAYEIAVANGYVGDEASWLASLHGADGSSAFADLTGVPADNTALSAALDAKATPADITAAIDALVGGAPGALDTLNEIAAALSDDANYAASVTTALAGKQPLNAILTALSGLTVQEGDLFIGKSDGTMDRLAKGNDGEALQLSGGLPTWVSTRQVLGANRDYFVRTDGSDLNDGLTNTAGGAFATIQKAVDAAYAVDNAGYAITIEVADGTYSAGAVFDGPLTGRGSLKVSGNTTTPANCVVNGAAQGFAARNNVSRIRVEGFKFTSGTNNIVAESGAVVEIGHMEFGGGSSAIYLDRSVVNVVGGGLVVSGNYSTVVSASTFGRGNFYGCDWTLSGTPAFSVAFVYATGLSSLLFTSSTFTGAATGTRYILSLNSTLETNGAGTSLLPGDSAGALYEGARYL